MTSTPRVPLLCAGDRLTRDEFERRYSAMPDLKKAELVEGVVYMGSPVRHTQHARPQALLAGWLIRYEALTAGLVTSDNPSLRLDLDNEFQPDLLLALPQRTGGRMRVSRGGWLDGAPELIVEIAASSVSYDLHDKLRVYRRHGVQEYVVWRTEQSAIDWFRLEREVYVAQPPCDGLYRSSTFPGLWLDVAAALRGDAAALLAAVDAGCATAEHRAFLARLQA